MPARLRALEIQYATRPLPLEGIVRYYFGDILNVDINAMPAISVMGRGYVVEPSGLGYTTRDAPRIEVECYISQDPNLTLTVGGQEYSFTEIMQIKIMRYARAIRELLIERRSLGATVDLLKISDVLVSDVLPFENIFLKACRVNVDITAQRR